MCEDLVSRLSQKRRDALPALCWADELWRGKVVTLRNNSPVFQALCEEKPRINADRFYLSSSPPRPPMITPFQGEVTWQCQSLEGEPDPLSDLLIIWIITNNTINTENRALIAQFPAIEQWKFDVYLTDLSATTGLHSHALLDRSPECFPLCLKIPLLSLLPKGRTVQDLAGHKLKVSATGVWPLRFYLVNTIVRLGGEEEEGILTPSEIEPSIISSPDEELTCVTPNTRIVQLNSLLDKEADNSRKELWPPRTKSTKSTDSSIPPTSPRSRSVGGPVQKAQRTIPLAQKSFQKLLQMRQRSRHESMSKIERDQIGIRVLAHNRCIEQDVL